MFFQNRNCRKGPDFFLKTLMMFHRDAVRSGCRKTVKPVILKSCLTSFAVTVLAALLLPRQLSATAEVIGYPVFYNYNAPLLLQGYWLLVGLFPVLSFVLYEV